MPNEPKTVKQRVEEATVQAVVSHRAVVVRIDGEMTQEQIEAAAQSVYAKAIAMSHEREGE